MAVNNSTGRKAKPHAPASAPIVAPSAVPRDPVHTFHGVEQPRAFSDGVARARIILTNFENSEPADRSIWDGVDDVTLRMLAETASHGGPTAVGLVASLCDYALRCMSIGEPVAAYWTPFRETWVGENFEIPPERCWFFDLDGVPYSVEANHYTLRWDDEESCHVELIEEIRDHAVPITRAQFEVLRWKRGQARRAAEVPHG